ncbi:MAG: polysaccharide deacetylase family protein [Gaiellaceae bacterium]
MSRPPLVLAYHGIGDVPRTLDPHNLFVPAERFVDQISRLRRRGYSFITLAEFAGTLANPERLRGACALTFDDGSVDNAVVLPDLLSSLEAPATVFVCPGLLGEPHPFLDPEAGIRLMTREEVAHLAGLPQVEIGSHTNRHTNLATAGGDDAYRELASSKQAVEEIVGRRVEAVAYPFCAYSPACPSAARRAGYAVAVTCAGRGSLNPYELRRESLDSLDGRLTFALKSRRWWDPLRRSPPGRVARRIARPTRHGNRGSAA